MKARPISSVPHHFGKMPCFREASEDRERRRYEEHYRSRNGEGMARKRPRPGRARGYIKVCSLVDILGGHWTFSLNSRHDAGARQPGANLLHVR
jgi:hypothetical protein